MNARAVERGIQQLEAALSSLETGQETAIRDAVVGLLEALTAPDPFGERRPDASKVIAVQDLQVVVNRLRVGRP